MFKSKHSGWTWELRRTPFGGGGSWTNQVSNDISGVLGTDGSGGGIIGNTQNIINSASSGNPLDVTSAILGTDGSGLGALGALAQVDNSVHTLIPGGWATVAAIAATIASAGGASPLLAGETVGEGGAIATGGEVAADGTVFAAGDAIPAGTTLTTGSDTAFMAADSANLASQGLSQDAIAQNLTSSYGISAADAQSLAAASTNAYAASGAAPEGFATTPTTGADQVLAQPDVNVNLGATNGGTVNSLNPALPAAGAPSGTSIGMSGQLAPGTIMGTGLEGGGAIGSTYAAGANGMPATDFFGNYIPASSINTGGVPNTVTGTSITSDTLNTLNNVKKGTDAANKLSQLLNQGAASGLSSSLGKLAAGQNASPEALPNLVRGNQNPFAYTAQQPIRDAQPMDLNSLANLLKQG